MRPWLGAEEAAAAAAAIASGWVAQGPRVAKFEDAFAARVGAQHGVAVSSCTAGLHLSLVVLGIGAGDEVVVPSLSFIATANAVRYVGATPVFCDVDAATLNITADTIGSVLTPATRAVIVVHQAGTPADLDSIHAVCDPLGILVVEDAACAVGSTYQGRSVGGTSELAAFSFHPRKLLTTGEGGMITTSRPEWATRLRRLREHGMSVSAAERSQTSAPVVEEYLETGFNYRMTDVQAAIGIVQLTRLDAMVARRRLLALRYQERLAGIEGLVTAGDPPSGTTNFQSFWITLPDATRSDNRAVLTQLAARGISARRGIMASHLEPAYAGHAHGPLPVTERLTSRSVILPLFHQMTDDEHERVVAAVQSAVCEPAAARS
jgi:perosamine synthetase